MPGEPLPAPPASRPEERLPRPLPVSEVELQQPRLLTAGRVPELL